MDKINRYEQVRATISLDVVAFFYLDFTFMVVDSESSHLVAFDRLRSHQA